MDKSRKYERMLLVYYLGVTNRATNQVMGHAVDISDDGLMMFSKEPIETGVIFQLQMYLPEELQADRHFEVTAVSKWCKKFENSEFYNTGFLFKDVSPEVAKTIKRLIDEFCH